MSSATNNLGHRANLVMAAAIAILMLAAGSALLPIVDPVTGARVIGALLLMSGLIELFAGSQRHEARGPAMLAGLVTTLAAGLFLLDAATKFLPTLHIIAGWLFLRSLVLGFAATRAHGAVRRWTIYSAAMDLVLALMMIVGLAISTLIVALFGPTEPMIASFAWVLAASFVVTGMMLMEIEHCLREVDA